MAFTSEHGTITAGQVVTVSVDADFSGIEVVNRDLAGEIWVRIDGEDPVPRGQGSFVVLGTRHFRSQAQSDIQEVRLTAELDRNFSVEGTP